MQGSSSGPLRRSVGEIIEARRVPLQAICSECGAAYLVSPQQLHSDWSCPQCGPSVPLGSDLPASTAARRSWRRRRHLPLAAAVLLLVSGGLFGVAWLGLWPTSRPVAPLARRTAAEPSAAEPPATNGNPRLHPETEAHRSDASPATPAAPVGNNVDPGPSDVATAAAAEPTPLTLGRLLDDPKNRLNQQFRLDCRLVGQSAQTPTGRLIAGWEGDQALTAGLPVGCLELEDPNGVRVAEAFVAAESQAVHVMPWLLEGDRLQVVGTVVIRIDRQSPQPAWAFLIHEIQPAP